MARALRHSARWNRRVARAHHEDVRLGFVNRLDVDGCTALLRDAALEVGVGLLERGQERIQSGAKRG